jgi:hypothetical protein
MRFPHKRREPKYTEAFNNPGSIRAVTVLPSDCNSIDPLCELTLLDCTFLNCIIASHVYQYISHASSEETSASLV